MAITAKQITEWKITEQKTLSDGSIYTVTAATFAITAFGQTREVECWRANDGERAWVPAVFGARVGATGQKIWRASATLWLKGGEWQVGSFSGGLNARSLRPVCWLDEATDKARCQRRYC